MDPITLLLIAAGIALTVVLYRFFYRQRDTGGTDQRNWVNDSNYNIATSDSKEEAIEGATPREAANIVANAKAEGPYPPSEEEFHELNKAMKTEKPLDTESVREELRRPA